MTNRAREFRQGVVDILPILAAAGVIGLLWGTQAADKGLSPLEAGLMSASVFAGASQIIAIELWRDPVPWFFLAVTALVVNIRHVLMGASLSRHMGDIPKGWRAPLLYVMADENWALSERRALTRPLTMAYYLGLGLPMVVTWTTSSVAGAIAGEWFRDPAAYGFDFAFSAMFIGILAGFWKGPKTGAVLAASAAVAAAAKLAIPGAWFVVLGGLAGVLVAVLLHVEEEVEATS
ncbi:MAG: AzlC family ABC transporter permease [Parvibaculaceae bacterium]